MSTLSGAELFRSVYEVRGHELRPLVGDAVNLLLARGDNSTFEDTENNIGFRGCALAIYDLLDQADAAANSRSGRPGFRPEVEDYIDLRALPEAVRTHSGINAGEDTDARELLGTISHLALCESVETTVPLIASDNMPDHDRLPSRVSIDSLGY